MGLALSGLASGFDWKSIVDQLIEVSRAPQNRMRRDQSANSTKTAALNDIKGLLSSLKSSLTSLSSTEALQKKSATFRDSTTDWTATADADTPSGTYNFSFVSEATTSKYQGANGIFKKLNADADSDGVNDDRETLDGTDPTDASSFSATPSLGAVLTPISNLPVGRTINGGSFTIDGVKITITTADSLDDVLSNITGNVPGVTATYNAVSDRIELAKAAGGSISLGASNDTSNFLQAMRLTSGASPVTTSGPTLSSPRLSGPIDSANLSGWGFTGVSSSFSINGVSISYNSATDSIQSLLNRINDSEAGVTATYDISAGTFLLTNKETGNVGIAVTADLVDTDGDGFPDPYDPDGDGINNDPSLAAALGLTTGTLTPGDDAVFSVNGGGNITSRSNILDESVHGITGLSVTANSIGSETITIGGDTTAAKDAINTFIEKYNAVQNAIEKYTKVTVDGTKVSSAVLAGSRELATISRELRRILYASQDGSGNQFVSGSIQRLSDLGVGFSGIENTISITNSTTLNNRLASDSDDVIEYFTTTDDGLVDRLDAMLDRLVSTSSTTPGTFQVQLDSISKQNKSLDKQIEEFERRLESQRALLENSFIAMERAQSGFQQQSAYLAKTFSGNSK